MKPIVRCFFVALTGGLFLAGLPSLSMGAVSASSPSTEEAIHDSDPWKASMVAFQHWRRSAEEGKSLDARKWCRQYVDLLKDAAGLGDVRGMVELGKVFSLGTEVFPADKAQAREWFKKAADAGDADSLYHLGFLAEHSATPDKAAASEWYSKAMKAFAAKAEKGDRNAAFWLGLMYRKGQGTERYLPLAYQWVTRAAEEGVLQAQILAAFMSREGEGCGASDEVAFKWFEKAAGKGDAGAMVEVALAYSDGKGVVKDEAQARVWLQKAVRMSDPFAMRLLADMLENGRGGTKDEKQGLAYYRQAASLGEGWSALRAYRMLQEGRGGERDEKMAIAVLSRAADEFNFPPAVFELGLHERNSGRRERGNALIEKAAKAGFVPAMGMLGKLYLFPVFEAGISWNPVAGCRWLAIASDRGDAEARSLLYWFIGGTVVVLSGLIVIFLWKMNQIIKGRQALLDEEEAQQNKVTPV